jgi:hypothetical protein
MSKPRRLVTWNNSDHRRAFADQETRKPQSKKQREGITQDKKGKAFEAIQLSAFLE